MIPIKLKMRNFMCYREVPPLSFEGIHTACLSGENGSGKSALIDAMTWAVWGKARTRSDDDLIHSRERAMEVEFDFKVANQLFRVIRKRSRPKRRGGQGQSLLDLQIATNGGFRSIAGNNITQTEQKIIGTLHMDYETFINSAYLRQGHADEFTTQIPSRRKEVLANILGLSDYDVYEERAKGLAREKEIEKAQLESSIREINEELARKPIYQADYDKAQSRLAEAEKLAKEKETKLNELRQQKESLERQKAQLEQLEASLRVTERNLKLIEEQIKQHQTRIQEYELLMAQREAIEEGYTRLVEARRLNEDFNRKLGLLVKLNERKNQLADLINREKTKLEQNQALRQSRIAELKTKIERLPKTRQEIEQLETALSQLAKREEALVQKKQAGDELQREVNHLESGQTQLEHELVDIEGKIHLLETQTEARCPLCETELTPEGLQLIHSKYITERNHKTGSLQSGKDQLAQKKRSLDELKSQLIQTETNLNRDRVTIEKGIAVLKKELTEAEEADKQVIEERNLLEAIEQQLAGKDFAINEQKALKEVETDLARLQYNAEQHQQVSESVKALETFQSRKYDLENAEKNLGQEREALIKADEAARETRLSLEANTQKKEALQTELALLPALARDVAQAETEYQALLTSQKEAQQAFLSIKLKLEHCAELEVKKKEKEELLLKAAKEEDIYKELARAFGKTGVQALLIEIALPEIEVEANRLLSRITDNRMHVKFETQKATKKGETVETLDINISDELGTRSYEMFSGGEAFRINFAVRIALSRLLARRAGAPLPTLIIDEGFGTQDATGIEKLKEAINLIQDDFEKIIVITHIEELRDAFPTRIDVIKTADGSTFSVS